MLQFSDFMLLVRLDKEMLPLFLPINQVSHDDCNLQVAGFVLLSFSPRIHKRSLPLNQTL